MWLFLTIMIVGILPEQNLDSDVDMEFYINQLNEYENSVCPLPSVQSNELQQIWKMGFIPKQLDNKYNPFYCYMVRLRREELINFVNELLSKNGDLTKITNIIHCVDSFYLVFTKNSAPNKDRWKKYKDKITPSALGIDFACKKLCNLSQIKSPSLLRDELESKSNNQVTLFLNQSECFLVGHRLLMNFDFHLENVLLV